MANWTQNSEVLGRWLAPDPPADDSTLTVKIGSAERQIRKAFPDMGDRLVAKNEVDELVEPDLAASIADVVYELLVGTYTNPTGVRTSQVTTGPFGESQTHGGDNPGRLSLDDEQRALLAPPRANESRLRTIDLGAGSALKQPVKPWWSV